MSNKLFIIGNGFDLAHNRPTRYSDFLLWYLNRLMFQSGPQKADELCSLVYHSNRNPFGSFQEFFDFIQSENVNWIFNNKFFEDIVKNVREPLWANIENIYYSYLLRFFRQTSDKLEGKQYNRPAVSYQPNKDVISLNNCLESITDYLVKYLKLLGPPIIKSEIKDHFQREFENQRNGDYSTFKSHFLIFNYTSTLDLYSQYLDPLYNFVNYIHGRIGDDGRPIIFGYGDESNENYSKIEDLNDNEFLKHIKSFYYLHCPNYQRLFDFIGETHFEVHLMGHSCGISDRVLLKTIFEHKYCDRIKIYYHQRPDGTNDFFEKTLEISRHFSLENKAIMRRRILPFEDCYPLS
jgi:hypothetical protein